ncbi:phosphatase PAP2 family protein [Aurantiacibacter marinus]|nr:phosphatase PAP2 family protein [Aurantiacibacter marinus]
MNRAHLVEGALFLVALSLMMQVYMVLKVSIPALIPFYADPWLADADALLFGKDPWRITHALLGENATRFLDMFYVTPCMVVTVGMTLWVCFSKDRAFSRRSTLAIMMCWFVIGIWAALLLSSAGPVYMQHFYGDPRFADLTAILPPDLIAARTQEYLLESFGSPGFGKGISAMPSMHNALYLLLIWMVHDRFGNGWQLWIAIAFEGLVFVASVHLGWHYALDAIVALVLVVPIWHIAGRIEKLPMPALRVSTIRAGARAAT